MKKRTSIPELTERPTPQNNPFAGDRQFVGALWRGLEVLRAFTPKDNGLSNMELSQRTGLGPSTVSRLTYTLARLGYVKYDPRNGSYHLGVPVLSLGFSCLAGIGIRALAQPIMQELAEKAGDGYLVSLATREMMDMTYIACARTDGAISLNLEVGSQVPLAVSSIGWAYMARAGEAERETVVTALKAQRGPEWPKVEALMGAAREEIDARGFCFNLGNWRRDVQAVATPVAPQGHAGPHFSLNIGGPTYVTSRERLEGDIAQAMMLAAQRIARYVG